MFQAPFGFVAILGVIALVGIWRQGTMRSPRSSKSAVRRYRPITLTAAAAVLALIPLAREAFWADNCHPKRSEHVAGALPTFTCIRRTGSQGPAARIALLNPSSVDVHHGPAAQFALEDLPSKFRKIRHAGMAGHRAQFVQRQLLGETVPCFLPFFLRRHR